MTKHHYFATTVIRPEEIVQNNGLGFLKMVMS